MEFIKIAKTEEIAEGKVRKFEVNNVEVAIARVDGQYIAFDDRCPHMNAPLSQGKVKNDEVECPFHHARFNLKTGQKTSDPKIPVPRFIKMGNMMANIKVGNLQLYNAKVEGDDIYLEV